MDLPGGSSVFEQMSNYFDASVSIISRVFSHLEHSHGCRFKDTGTFRPGHPRFRIEFNERKYLSFDYDVIPSRLSNEAVAWEVFGKDSDQVKADHSQWEGNGFFSLKAPFNTHAK